MTNQPDRHSRATLPIPRQPYAGLIKYDAKDPEAKFPPIEPLRPPNGAPNVLVILLDDAGFGASSAFGGPIHTPTAERLAASGLKYNRFHTTALCCADARRRCSPGATTTPSAWAASPNSPPPRRATARSGPTPARRWR